MRFEIEDLTETDSYRADIVLMLNRKLRRLIVCNIVFLSLRQNLSSVLIVSLHLGQH